MIIVSLFDMSGYAVKPWALAGCTCYVLDLKNSGKEEKFPSGGSITWLHWDATWPNAKSLVKQLFPDFLISMPPCTDLTVAGAKHFASKKEKDAFYLHKALEMVMLAPVISNDLEIPFVVENPVGVISSMWREPDYIFDPCDYGGYLFLDDQHPDWPQYIEGRDAYEKATCIWGGNGVIIPGQLRTKVIVQEDALGRKFNKQTTKLGGKSERTKMIRSLSPRGFFQALFEANFLGPVELPAWRKNDWTVYYKSSPRTLK